MLSAHWPLAALVVTTPRLTLCVPTDDQLAAVADVAADGVHLPGERPFFTLWTDAGPAERAQHVLQQHWYRRGVWDETDWALELAVFHEGTAIGMVTLKATEFAVEREVRTESWFGLSYHRQGFGTEARAALLHLAFDGLHARAAVSDVLQDNAGSRAVSRRLGYRHTGTSRDYVLGELITSTHLRLDAGTWPTVPRPPATVTNLGPCLPLFDAEP